MKIQTLYTRAPMQKYVRNEVDAAGVAYVTTAVFTDGNGLQLFIQSTYTNGDFDWGSIIVDLDANWNTLIHFDVDDSTWSLSPMTIRDSRELTKVLGILDKGDDLSFDHSV